jgi:hypothetical protein
MKKKAAKTSLRMPIFGGVVISRGGEARDFPRGVYVVSGGAARRVQKLFVDSAGFTGPKPPKNFTMSAGEIFYEGGAIAEARLTGTLPPVKNEDWADLDPLKDEDWVEMRKRRNEKRAKPPLIDDDEEWIWERPAWSTDPGPDTPWIDDLRLAFSPRNLGRPFVAALRIGGPILLWWDVESARTRHTPADADVRHVRVTQPVKVSGGMADRRGYEAAIRYAGGLAKSAEAMKTLLSRLRDGGELDFIDERRAFGNAFRRLLTQRVDERSSGSTGPLSISMRRLKETKMRGKLLNAVAAMTSDYLLIRPGRPPGSQTKTPNLKSKKIEYSRERGIEIEQMIVGAIRGEYEKFCGECQPAEAEFRVNRKIVYQALDISKNTLYNWLRRSGRSFEKLKTKALKSAQD